VFPGIAIGVPFLLPNSEGSLPIAAGYPEIEKARFAAALGTVRGQLSQLYGKALSELGESQVAVVEVQLLLLEDPELLEAVTEAIEQGISAAAAVSDVGEAFARIFAAMEDTYMQARGEDIRDLCQQIRDALVGKEAVSFPEEPFLLVAEELSPCQTLSLPRDRVLGFVTREGSPLSHTAILAQTWGLPSLVQADILPEALSGCEKFALDSCNGRWYADPDTETLAMLEQKQLEARREQEELEAFRTPETRSRLGTPVSLMANIGSPADAEAAKAVGAEGVGLLRSEFLYLGRDTLPSEDELYAAYRRIGQIMGDRPVLIRTLDIGADKQSPCLQLASEENPALGLRGIRLCLERQDVFRTQLRAIYRASAFGNLHILFPMVSALWELQAAKSLCAQVRTELKAPKIPIGIMVETPAAAILAEDFAREADFFSVGTNDLTQYTLAADRQHTGVLAQYDPKHPALLALLGHIAQAAQQAGIWAGVCGELAADPELQETLIRIGYRKLSMAPSRIPESRKRILQFDF
jgi:phosphotransferase system enzyme I (PtsI)